MNKHEKKREWIKNGIILILVVCAAALLRYTDYYSNASSFFSGLIHSRYEDSPGGGSDDGQNLSAIHIDPMAVSVYLGSGSRYASIYDKSSIQEDYQRFSAYLAEALGSSGEPVKLSREDWIKALGRESVYIAFQAPQPLSELSALLGAQMSSVAGSSFSRELCLSCDEEQVGLFFVSDGEYYYCSTGVSDDALRARLTEFVPNSTQFSHEMSMLSDMKDSILVPQSLPEICTVIPGGAVSQARMRELLFPMFGINEYSISEYSGGNGTVVYREDDCALHISTGGTAEYFLDDDSQLSAKGDSLQSAIELCWQMVDASIAGECGEADIYMAGAEYDSKADSIRVYFAYSINSIPIRLSDGAYAAEFEIKASVPVYAKFCFRSFSLGEDKLEVLPLLQAAAIASANGSAGIRLSYSESGSGISCVWVPQ